MKKTQDEKRINALRAELLRIHRDLVKMIQQINNALKMDKLIR